MTFQSAITPTPIIVWCHPRSVSSAFERAFMQRKDTRSYHEPLSMPFYYGSERACRRYSDQECKQSAPQFWQSSIEQTLMEILTDSESGTQSGNVTVGQFEQGEQCRYIFIKDMAQYIFSPEVLRGLHPESTVYKDNGLGTPPLNNLNNPTVLPIDLLRRFKHTFLMRTPKKSVPSYWKCVENGAAGFSYFDAAETGYIELKILYDWMANSQSSFHKAPENERISYPGQIQAQPMPPPLVDASDLLAHPDAIVESYCAAIGVPFDSGMLTWESGRVNAFSSWQGYHADAENSTGFKKETPTSAAADLASRKRREDSVDSGVEDHNNDVAIDKGAIDEVAKTEKQFASLPAQVRKAIDSNMDSYNYLYAFRSFRNVA